MTDFSFICIGAHTGYWIDGYIKKNSQKKILLVEPVKYNIAELKGDRTKVNWIRIGMKNNNFYVRKTGYGYARSIK